MVSTEITLTQQAALCLVIYPIEKGCWAVLMAADMLPVSCVSVAPTAMNRSKKMTRAVSSTATFSNGLSFLNINSNPKTYLNGCNCKNI